MVLIISQQTFDDAVRENIEELGLEPQEALEEAVTQFESQVSPNLFIPNSFIRITHH